MSASFSPARRWGIAFNVGLSVVATIALVIMANYLAIRYSTRLDWTPNASLKLSPLTMGVLESLTNRIKVTIFYPRDENLYHSISALLKEYQVRNPRHIIVEYLDYLRQKPAEADRLKRRLRLSTATDHNLVIFESEGKPPRVVYQKELSQYDLESVVQRRSSEVKRTGFKGELLFTSAIAALSDPRPLNAHFVQGHGEHDVDSDRADGYSTFITHLHQLGIFSFKISLRGTNEIPDACDLLVVAGATQPYSDADLTKIHNYLERGGRVLACFRYHHKDFESSRLELMLRHWGVDVGENSVLDLRNTLNQGQDMVCTNFSTHPVTRSLIGSEIWLVMPRSIDRRPLRASADAPKVEPIVMTSEHGEVRRLLDSPAVRTGAIPVVAAVERGALQGIKASKTTTRIVVTGDSLFLENRFLDLKQNRYFATAAVNWLLDRHALMGGLGPRPIEQFTLLLTEDQMRSVRWILLAGLPGAVLLVGGLVGWFRRH